MSVTVLTPAASKRLTTPSGARGDLGLSAESPSDEQLSRFIDQVSAKASTFCRRAFGRTLYRERINCRRPLLGPNGGILLEHGPIVRVLGAMMDGVTYAPASFEVVNGRELFLTYAGNRCGWRGYDLSIDYEAGWLLPGESRTADGVTSLAEDLPADIELAAIQLVGVSVSMLGRDITVKSEDVEGVGSTSWYVQGANAALPHPEAEATLTQYRRVPLS